MFILIAYIGNAIYMLRIWLAIGACIYGYVTGDGKSAMKAFISCIFIVYVARIFGLLALGHIESRSIPDAYPRVFSPRWSVRGLRRR